MRWSKTITPVMSLGSRSGVNCTRFQEPAIEPAMAFAIDVLPVPGTSSMQQVALGEQAAQREPDRLGLATHDAFDVVDQGVRHLRDVASHEEGVYGVASFSLGEGHLSRRCLARTRQPVGGSGQSQSTRTWRSASVSACASSCLRGAEVGPTPARECRAVRRRQGCAAGGRADRLVRSGRICRTAVGGRVFVVRTAGRGRASDPSGRGSGGPSWSAGGLRPRRFG